MVEVLDAQVNAAVSGVPPEVMEFAKAKGVGGHLDAVIDLAHRAFPATVLHLSLAQDAEDETHQYIALDVDAGGLASEDLLTGQRTGSVGLSRVCPPPCAVYFVLGWR
ncbi:MAG: hypothetical protein HY289_08125 [Planctomycetes bacterium]|nr:hypothetical protein [Planctomycetota bacterium]